MLWYVWGGGGGGRGEDNGGLYIDINDGSHVIVIACPGVL